MIIIKRMIMIIMMTKTIIIIMKENLRENKSSLINGLNEMDKVVNDPQGFRFY